MRTPRAPGALTLLLLVAATAGLGSRPAAADPTVRRLAGPDRFATAAAVSEDTYTVREGRPVYAVNASAWADALAAGPIAGLRAGPVLLVGIDAVPEATAGELRRLRPASIVVVGGPSAVSPGVEEDLHQFAAEVERVAGTDRYATAAALARTEYIGTADVAYVVSGETFADALSAGAGAAARGPVLLTERDRLPEVTRAELDRIRPLRIAVVGGPGAVSLAVEDAVRPYAREDVVRVSGADRYETSAALAEFAFPEPVGDRVYLASGTEPADGLSATPAAVRAQAPVLLTRPDCRPLAIQQQIDRLDPAEIVVVGGTAAVSDDAAHGEPCLLVLTNP